MKAKYIIFITLILVLVITASDSTVLANSGPEQPPAQTLYFPLSYAHQIQWGGFSEGGATTTLKYWNPDTPLGVSVRWAEIDADPTSRDWTEGDKTVGNLPVFLLVLKTTPAWALAPGEPMCKLPQEIYWPDFVEFARAAALRYAPEYIGIWNEPDVEDDSFPQHYGCVGDAGLYSDFVTYIYQNIGDIGDTKILAGNVAAMTGGFATDVLAALGDNYDAWGIHCYASCYQGIYYNRCMPPYLAAGYYLNRYNPDADLIISETAVLEHSELGCSLAQFQKAQIKHYRALDKLPVFKLWYTPGGNGWPAERPSDMYPNPVWYLYMGLTPVSIETDAKETDAK